MIRYVALLRGINISGKNKIPMPELKKGFESLSFENVRTYLNSGNVLFSTSSLTTPEGLSTTSPAAIMLVRCSSNVCILLMYLL